MASKADKLLEKLRQTKRNWNHEHLHVILQSVGFGWRDSAHRVYRHPDFADLESYPIPRADGLAPQYAKDVLLLVEDVLERQKDAEDGEEEET